VQSKRIANQCHGLTANKSSGERTFLGANTLENKSSLTISLRGAKVPRSELAREQKGCESNDRTNKVDIGNKVKGNRSALAVVSGSLVPVKCRSHISCAGLRCTGKTLLVFLPVR